MLPLIIGCFKVKWKKLYSTVFPEGNNIDELIHHAKDTILNSLLGNHESDKFWPYAVHVVSCHLYSQQAPPARNTFIKTAWKLTKNPTGSKKLALAMFGKFCNELASHQQMILCYDKKKLHLNASSLSKQVSVP